MVPKKMNRINSPVDCRLDLFGPFEVKSHIPLMRGQKGRVSNLCNRTITGCRDNWSRIAKSCVKQLFCTTKTIRLCLYI